MSNKSKKTFKSCVIYTLLTLSVFTVWYLGTAFVLLEMDFTKWEESARLLVALEGAITSIIVIIIYEYL